MSRECRVIDFIALTRLSNSPCTFQRWPIPTFGAPIESLDRQNSKSVSHSPISEHLKLAETETVSSPPFQDIGLPTHLLGVGRGNLTNTNVKKGSSPGLLCVACLWNPNYSLLVHKYGRNLWKMPKIGQNCMKKWPFFAIFLPWMASYGPKRSFLFIFSARDDLVKVSWKSDAGKCPNQVTPPYFD